MPAAELARQLVAGGVDLALTGMDLVCEAYLKAGRARYRALFQSVGLACRFELAKASIGLLAPSA